MSHRSILLPVSRPGLKSFAARWLLQRCENGCYAAAVYTNVQLSAVVGRSWSMLFVYPVFKSNIINLWYLKHLKQDESWCHRTKNVIRSILLHLHWLCESRIAIVKKLKVCILRCFRYSYLSRFVQLYKTQWVMSTRQSRVCLPVRLQDLPVKRRIGTPAQSRTYTGNARRCFPWPSREENSSCRRRFLTTSRYNFDCLCWVNTWTWCFVYIFNIL